MNWITIVWSMNAAACLTLAGIFFVAWCKQRDSWGHLIFSCIAVAAAGIAVFDAACSQSRLNSKSCPEVVRRYGNSSLNATMIFTCGLARTTAGVGALLRCLRRKQFPLKHIWFYSTSQRVNGIDKLIDILEALVN